MRILESLSVPVAIVIGSVIIGISIVGATVVAPYRLESFGAAVWKFNTITGAARYCTINTAFGLDCR